MESFKRLFVILWIIFGLLGIGWAILPFILAKVLELSWINWFGILTIPSAIILIVIIFLQRKMIKEAENF